MIDTVISHHAVEPVQSRPTRVMGARGGLRQRSRTALVVVDPNLDFCEGGSLAVPGAEEAMANVASHLERLGDRYDAIVATSDWHVDPGEHFAQYPDFINSWPAHCVAGTRGAEFHPAVSDYAFTEVVYKGDYSAAYSGFEGSTREGVSLAELLSEQGITWVAVCGLATDYCVRATCLDALREGLGVSLLSALCAAVTPDGGAMAERELISHGVGVVDRIGAIC